MPKRRTRTKAETSTWGKENQKGPKENNKVQLSQGALPSSPPPFPLL